MNHSKKELHEQTIMEFRHSMVAELANPYLDHGERTRLIKEKAARQWDMPWSKKDKVTEATIKYWLECYRKQGKEGLRPKRRSDTGQCRAASPEEADALAQLLETQPELTARAAWNKLKDQGKVQHAIASSSLSRLVLSRGLGRKDRQNDKVYEQCRKFEFFIPLDCVQADCLHGPSIPDKGKSTKAILLAFIDDATRLIVFAEFSTSEQSLNFERGIRHIIMAHGRIGRLYVDNGSTFVSLQTKRILDTLQINLVHSTPHKPRGRGKIERFFRTVRDCFLRPLDLASIAGFDDLNMRFRTWLEAEYHRNPHNGLLGTTPLEAWLKMAGSIQTFNPTVDLEQVFFHECHRRVNKDQTVSIDSTLFEVPPVLIGKQVMLRYNPHKPRRVVEAWYEGKNYGECRVLDRYANTRVRRKPGTVKKQEQKTEEKRPSVHAGLSAAGLRREAP
jgi:transposase